MPLSDTKISELPFLIIADFPFMFSRKKGGLEPLVLSPHGNKTGTYDDKRGDLSIIFTLIESYLRTLADVGDTLFFNGGSSPPPEHHFRRSPPTACRGC